MTQPQGRKTSKNPINEVIAVLLAIGVGLSAVVLATGALALVLTGQSGYSTPLDRAVLVARQGTVPFPNTIDSVFRDALALRPFALIELGALLLIATPILRVGASIILLLAERDYLYVAITSAVLGFLLLGLLWI